MERVRKVYKNAPQEVTTHDGALGLPEKYELDAYHLNRAFKKIGHHSKLRDALSDEEIQDASQKGLTVIQWKLLWLFKTMFYDEYDDQKSYYAETGLGEDVKAKTGSFRQKTLANHDISERVLIAWAHNLGISHLYTESLGSDVHDIRFHIFENSSGMTVYDRLYAILRILSFE